MSIIKNNQGLCVNKSVYDETSKMKIQLTNQAHSVCVSIHDDMVQYFYSDNKLLKHPLSTHYKFNTTVWRCYSDEEDQHMT